MTGFSLILDATNTFATSSVVTGKAYAASYTAPTPAKMTTAIGDMGTAYTDAAGRVTPDFIEFGAGSIQGATLTAGLYKWGGGVGFTSAVTIHGSSTDIFIFQIAGNLIVGNGAIVTLTGGAQPQNIVWQVAGQVTLGTTSQMKGTILCKTAVVCQTGSSLVGQILAQTAATLDATTIVKPTIVVQVEEEEQSEEITAAQVFNEPEAGGGGGSASFVNDDSGASVLSASGMLQAVIAIATLACYMYDCWI
jgi:hypothetical protein